MNRWLKFLMGLYVVAWAVSLVGCTEANIPRGTIRANGIPSSISLQVLPDTCVPEDLDSGKAIASVLATVKDELGNPASGSVLFVATGQTVAPVAVILSNGVAQKDFTLSVTGTPVGFQCTDVGSIGVFQITGLIADIATTTNVSVINTTNLK